MNGKQELDHMIKPDVDLTKQISDRYRLTTAEFFIACLTTQACFKLTFGKNMISVQNSQNFINF